MSQIFYNSLEILSGQPTPFVARNVQPYFRADGRRLGSTQLFTLNGQLTGCVYENITGAAARLDNILSKDFGSLRFVDDGYDVTYSGCKVNNLNYTQGTFVGVQEYTAELECRPQEFFESVGIIEKRNDWNVAQGEDSNLTISHEIYAKGINTAPSFDNAFENAKNFVLQYTGWNPPFQFPFFVSGFSGSLDSRAESANRLDASFSIIENYIGRTGSKIQEEITVTLESGSNGIISVSVGGTYRLGKGEDFDLLRQKYSGVDIYGLATGAYDSYRGVSGLVNRPLESGVTESIRDNSLSFDVAFNDWPTTLYRHIYEVKIASGTNEIITADVNGTIEGLGKLPTRYDRAYAFFQTLNIYDLANEEYLNYVGANFPFSLNKYPVSSGTSVDRFAGTIGYNSSFTDRSLAMTGDGIKQFDVNFNKKYAMRRIAPIPIINSISGLDSVDLLYSSRGNLTVNGTVQMDKPYTSIDATGKASQYVNLHFMSGVLFNTKDGTYKTKVRMDEGSIQQNTNKDSCNFSVSYSFDEPIPFNPSSSYTLITGLKL